MIDRILFACKNYQSAIIAAVFFGCIAPGTKLLTNDIPPQTLAGILYLFAGLGLFIVMLIKNELWSSLANFRRNDFKWLCSAILSGGVLGPAFLTYGLMNISGSSASLLLNMEAVLTSFIAWFVFKEHFEKRIFWGMVTIIAGCLILSVNSSNSGGSDSLLGVFLVLLACLSWGIDNNVTRNISHLNPLFIASTKGIIAGLANLLIGLALGERFSITQQFFMAGLLGFLGIGVSLTSFIVSLRRIGTARTGALFSTAPFIGALVSLIVLKEPLSIPLIIALVMMGIGVWLHLSENHDHDHDHEELEHIHEHSDDEHHDHLHTAEELNMKPHHHTHKHEKHSHSHPHFPDIHHRHPH